MKWIEVIQSAKKKRISETKESGVNETGEKWTRTKINNNFSMRMTFYPYKNQSCGFFFASTLRVLNGYIVSNNFK